MGGRVVEGKVRGLDGWKYCHFFCRNRGLPDGH